MNYPLNQFPILLNVARESEAILFFHLPVLYVFCVLKGCFQLSWSVEVFTVLFGSCLVGIKQSLCLVAYLTCRQIVKELCEGIGIKLILEAFQLFQSGATLHVEGSELIIGAVQLL